MIKVYRLKIGEKIYEVELEAITEKEGQISSIPQSKTEIAETSKEQGVTSASGIFVEAPMQGVVIDVVVSVGDQVEEGEELLILEAMKMENAIVAPQKGKVTGIHISKGDTVDSGKVLITLS